MKRIVSGLSACALGATLVLAGTPAFAAVPGGHGITPYSAQNCSGDVCMNLGNPNTTTGNVTIKAWAYDANFYGHFELTGPGGLVSNSATVTFLAGGASGTGASWTTRSAVGTYCVIAWRKNSNGTYSNLGKQCENIE